MKRMTLLIMAAGIGSRYGGIKQLEPVGLHGEIIMDFSIHDAIAAGFNKIIFVIRREIEADFRERIGDRIESVCARLGVETAYAFQDPLAIPEGFTVPEGRVKPWGTCQAVLAAKDLIREPFVVINSDDYYGRDAYKTLYDWLSVNHAPTSVAMAGFVLKNTLSDHGGVTRGICQVPAGKTHVTDVKETKNIVKTPTGAEADGVPLDPDSYVSMNMWAFPGCEGQRPAIFDILEREFVAFFEIDVPKDPLKAEYLLPVLMGRLLRAGTHTVKLLPTRDSWFGVTYKEDKPAVAESFRRLIESGVYPENLYSDL